jgi:ferredoxin
LKIEVNKENCIGCGLCVNICPEVFAIDENGKSEVLEDNIEKFKNAIDDSIRSCPVNAIEEV